MQHKIGVNLNVISSNRAITNPFEKKSFTKYRDWEESLIEFMAEQVKSPNLLLWQQLMTSEKSLNNACCCAIILANTVEYEYSEQSRKLFQISGQLKEITTDEFNTWLQSGWLDLPSINNGLQPLLSFS